ncbi:MAG: leucine--tRNA ligase [Dehalococcoidia bacterium]
MVERYNPQEIQAKWQRRWEEDELYRTPLDSDRPKFFFLTMYPYPSGDLHIGHWYAEAPADARARYLRMRGYNVLFPMGFDAFGLPAENAAIRNNIHPYRWTLSNIDRMRKQFKQMGAMFDWSREIITCQPEYYRWNQWFFLQFYNKGLAYRRQAAVDWCPTCNTTLAREQVWGDERRCERCETPVTKRDLAQWFLQITKYADELLDFDGLNWPERVVTMQRNWIGRSEGAELRFQGTGDRGQGGVPSISVFTTRPDTVFGVTFLALAPEHPLVAQMTTGEHRAEVEAYIEQARRQTEIDRLATDREKTGVFTGGFCRNPFNGAMVPIVVADYVLLGYGTGAVMGVPAHDQRDFEFARRYDLPITVVIRPPDWLDGAALAEAYTGPGTMVNSGRFDGMPNDQGKGAVVALAEQSGFGGPNVTYRLRDWLISRQRYWGTPIPIIYCRHCGTVPVPEEQLPVLLPEDAEFLPTGESPLRFHDGFRRTTCPTCGEPAERETDTMDTFVDSSWYQYRYLSPHDDSAPFASSLASRWLPVDVYTGGIEHATMHLLYTRFFTKAMRDAGLIEASEPILRLFNQGIILGPDSQKMSKSRGNVVNPDDYVQTVGADAVRIYLMFIGPWDQGGPFSLEGIEGISRWLGRLWTLIVEEAPAVGSADEETSRAVRRVLHQTIGRVTEDMEAFHFNTMVAALMELTTALARAKASKRLDPAVLRDAEENLVQLLAPSAPHLAEELWQRLGYRRSVHLEAWPAYDAELARKDEVTLVVQVNGKLRERLTVQPGLSEEAATRVALESPKVATLLNGKQLQRAIYRADRLINLVVV